MSGASYCAGLDCTGRPTFREEEEAHLQSEQLQAAALLLLLKTGANSTKPELSQPS